jgi:hypothetical protein
MRESSRRKRYDLVVGAFDWFSRRAAPGPPADLREALMAAVSGKDGDALAHLIDANSEAIRKAFAEWKTVPVEIRNDPDALERYPQTMFTVASVFERSGDASLMTQLGRNSPIEQWRTLTVNR